MSNALGYPPTGTMLEVTRNLKCYVRLAFRICDTKISRRDWKWLLEELGKTIGDR